MPKSSARILRWCEEEQRYALATDGEPQKYFTAEDDTSWLHWLAEQTSFSFRGRLGRMSVVKESRPRGTGYWYAYRSRGRRTVKRYLGGDDDLSFPHLENMASELASLLLPIQAESSEEPDLSIGHPSSTLLLLSAKLSVPRLPDVLVERMHLLSRLERALAQRLIVLQAPAGFGKTTLVNQWLTSHSSALAVAWVSLDTGDNDTHRFWRYVITACRSAQLVPPDQGQAALELVSGSMQTLFARSALETALTLLLNGLAEQRQEGVLVLDDYHCIEEPRIHETLTFFIEHLPPTMRVLLLSRTEPPLPLLKWRARGAVQELHLADLRFSMEETATFWRQTLSLPLSTRTLAHLDTLLEGWTAGLRLLAVSLQRLRTGQEIEQALVSLAGHTGTPYQSLLDYLVMEILDTQPEPVQRFLLQTSVLSRLSAPLCDALIGENHSAELLTAIERAGLLLEALDHERIWYRYHALLAEALRREATRRLGVEALEALSLRASHWYEQHGRLEEATEMALQAGDLERVARLIELIDAREQDVEPQTLRRWLAHMSEELLQAHPALCLLFAILLRFPEEGNETQPLPAAARERIEYLLKLAEQAWYHQGKQAWIGVIEAFRALGAWQLEPISVAVAYAQHALALLPEDDAEPRLHRWRSLCLSVIGSWHMYEGRFDEARRLLWEAQAGRQNDSNQHLLRGTILLLALSYYAQGHLHQAAECYQRVLSLARLQKNPEQTADALLGLARLEFEWNDIAAAEHHAREAYGLLQYGQELRESATLQLALIYHVRGETTLAQQQIAALLSRLQPLTTSLALLLLPVALLWQARLYLATGNLGDALHCYELLTRYERGFALTHNLMIPLLHVRLLLAQGQADEARAELERLLPIAEARRDLDDLLEVYVLLALAHAATQERQEAQRWLVQALMLAQSEGFVRLFLSEGEALLRLLRQVLPTLHDASLRSYAHTILRAFTTSSEQNVTVGLPAEQLSPQEQRVLRLLAAGRSNPQIAQELVVSINTVKDHVKKLYRKLGVNNRLQASEMARHLELL
jgi:LuxR family maltose regulon positive regulatory protein